MSEPGDKFENLFLKEILEPPYVVPTMDVERTIKEIWKISVDESVMRKEMLRVIVEDKEDERNISIKGFVEMYNPMQYRANVDGEEITISYLNNGKIHIQIPHFTGTYKLKETTLNNTHIEHENIIRGQIEMISYPIKIEDVKDTKVVLDINYMKI